MVSAVNILRSESTLYIDYIDYLCAVGKYDKTPDLSFQSSETKAYDNQIQHSN